MTGNKLNIGLKTKTSGLKKQIIDSTNFKYKTWKSPVLPVLLFHLSGVSLFEDVRSPPPTQFFFIFPRRYNTGKEAEKRVFLLNEKR